LLFSPSSCTGASWRVKGDEPKPQEEVKALLARSGSDAVARGGRMSLVAQLRARSGAPRVLTEYEEHRLRTNIQAGLAL